MPVCVKCLDDRPEEAFGVQAIKIDNRPGRKPRANVRNSRCLECDSRAQRKDGDVASPAEIQERWRSRPAPTAANQNESTYREPDGFIRFDGEGMAVWLAPGTTPAQVRNGLVTWCLTRGAARRA